jgi:hypothetical protein
MQFDVEAMNILCKMLKQFRVIVVSDSYNLKIYVSCFPCLEIRTGIQTKCEVFARLSFYSGDEDASLPGK